MMWKLIVANALRPRQMLLKNEAITEGKRFQGGINLDLETQFLDISQGRKVAYCKLEPKSSSAPTLVYIPGIYAHKGGKKAMAVQRYCQENGLGCVRFEVEGIGESVQGGKTLEQVEFSDWVEDTKCVFEEVVPAASPLLVVGPSMGAWLFKRAASESIFARTVGVVFIGCAFNFIKPYFDVFYEHADADARLKLNEGKLVTVTHPKMGPYPVSKRLADSSEPFHIGGQEVVPIRCPVRFLHGMKDLVAPWKWSVEFSKNVESTDVDILIRKDSGHEFDSPTDLQTLIRTVDSLLPVRYK